MNSRFTHRPALLLLLGVACSGNNASNSQQSTSLGGTSSASRGGSGQGASSSTSGGSGRSAGGSSSVGGQASGTNSGGTSNAGGASLAGGGVGGGNAGSGPGAGESAVAGSSSLGGASPTSGGRASSSMGGGAQAGASMSGAGGLTTGGVSGLGGGTAAGGSTSSAGGTAAGGSGTGGSQSQVPGLTVGPKLDVADHACAIHGTELRCWGSNSTNELGYVGRGTQNATPTVVEGAWLAVAVANANFDDGVTCGIKTDLSLWCWGENWRGSLGPKGSLNGAAASAVPLKVGDGFVRVAYARHTGCAIKTDGSLWCWGEGGYALRGTGSMTDSLTPTQVAAGKGPFVDIEMDSAAAGAVHRSSTGTGTMDVFWSWGHRYDPTTTDIANANVYKSTAGPQLASATDTLGAPATQVSVGESNGLLRDASGVWRFAQYGYPMLDATAPAGVTDVAAAGTDNMCAIDKDGKLWCRGYNQAGQLGDGYWVTDHQVPKADAWTEVKAPQGKWVDVALGYYATVGCARDTDDAVWCWGDNTYGQLGDGTFKSRSAPSLVGSAPPTPTCSDGIANGNEVSVDCGGSCPACPPWCEDLDKDGYGRGGACLGTDCDDSDATIYNTCWIRTLFGGKPGTKAISGTIEPNDQICVVNFAGSGCYAQNDPPCRNDTTAQNVTLNVTLAADGSLSVAVPYQEMCAPDYWGSVVDIDGNPTGGVYPATYPVPMFTTFWYFKPRATDYCRVDGTGQDSIIEQRANTTIVGQQIWITQDCFTELRVVDPNTQANVSLFDTRSWTVKLGTP